MQKIKNVLIGGALAFSFIFVSHIPVQSATDLATINPSAAANFVKVSTEMSTYLSTRTPFFASLGRNDYRAALPGALAPMPSFLLSAGAGLGLMGNFDSIQKVADATTSIGTGSMSSFPFLIGPSIYARVAVPWLPVIGGIDVGFKLIPAVSLSVDNLEYKNGGYGFDIRYAILRDIPLIPLIHLSLAIGFAYDQLDGSFKTKGTIASNGISINGQFGPEWSVNSKEIFLQATAKIFIVSAKVGAGYILPGGETKTQLTGDVAGTPIVPIGSTVKAEDGYVKLTAGVGITFLPFISLYVEGNRNMTTNDIAGTAAINLTF